MGEEAELLRGMIADRDQRIALIQRKTEEFTTKEEKLSEELRKIQGEKMDQQLANQSAKTLQQETYWETKEKLDVVRRDLQKQGASLQTYAGVIKKEHVSDSSFVMRMQAQLCKAMHSMGIIDHQLDITKKHCSSLIKFQKERMAAMADEKSQMELEMLNDLMKADVERKEVEAEGLAKLAEIRKDIEGVEQQIAENIDSDAESDEDEDEEEDEEEKEAKEELLKMLQERKDEIARLEQENQEKEDIIEELRDMEDSLPEGMSESFEAEANGLDRSESSEEEGEEESSRSDDDGADDSQLEI